MCINIRITIKSYICPFIHKFFKITDTSGDKDTDDSASPEKKKDDECLLDTEAKLGPLKFV